MSYINHIVADGGGGIKIEWHRRQQDLEIAFTAGEAPQFFYRNRATGAMEEGSARETEKLIRFVKSTHLVCVKQPGMMI